MAKRKRGIITRLRTIFASSESKQNIKAQRILTDWEAVYKDLQAHPLTQAKVINEQILATTNETIKRFDRKLSGFDDRIVKLEQRRIKVIRNAQEVPLEYLDSASKPNSSKKKGAKSGKETPTQIVNRVIADPHMNDHEKEMIKRIQEHKELDAQSLAEQFHISRSNASLKLNKLHDWGFLSKRMVDKTVFYRIKDSELA
ncbi:helix-turn-helix transcriptional regulator [Candidatus Woesearchaeota archaeon]|jgi:hypothetical protein|nr:helix-turn-helix transcriptional regulator [Candidatus Woesearchaeota archaeon]MBT4248633.1 helix-turn-helix transcriptional regulator [Candidatus Woesearchaeota archaeon]